MTPERPRRDLAPDRESEREAFEKIEDLECGPYPLATAALVLAGERPATTVELYPWNDPSEKVEGALAAAGLLFRHREHPDTGTGEKRTELLIARDRETLDRLELAEASRDHEEYGRLMGFPQSAIDAFLGRAPEYDKSPGEIEPGNIIQMKLSADHWQEEMETLRRWNEVIRTKMPKIYDKLAPKK